MSDKPETLGCPVCAKGSGVVGVFSEVGLRHHCAKCDALLELHYEETLDGEGSWNLTEVLNDDKKPADISIQDVNIPDIVDPRTVYLAIPCADGRLMSEVAGSIAQTAGLWGGISMPAECSHVSLVRNLIAAQFLASPFEWLVCVDNDIRFSREDLLLLLQPRGPSPHSHEMLATPTPTRIDTGTASGTRTMADVLVCAEYPYKNDNLEPVKNGMGFVRIHRSVFRTLEQLKQDGGTVNVPGEVLDRLAESFLDTNTPTDEHWEWMRGYFAGMRMRSEDTRGAGRLWTCSWQGRQFYDFFPSGPLLSQFLPHQQWKGEDHGFFTLCMLAGIVSRIETRTRLVHIGRKAYVYPGPDFGAGQ